MRSLATAAVAALIVAGTAVAQPLQTGPAPGHPELVPLAAYAGVWDTDLAVRPHGHAVAKPHPKGVLRSEWVNGGMTLRQTWAETAGAGLPALSGVAEVSYDRVHRHYAKHATDSTGAVTDSVGQWDAAGRAMVWTEAARADGRVRVTREAVRPDGTLIWELVERDRSGQVVAQVDGVSTRRK